MKISIIAAVSDNEVIGFENKLPWRQSDDLKRFKRITSGKIVIMGRKTADSLGRALPHRRNIVLTRLAGYAREGFECFGSLKKALASCCGDLMIIGGGGIYKQCLPIATHMYLTRVHAEVKGDVWFPEINHGEWQKTYCETHKKDDRNQYGYSFMNYVRV